MATIPAELDRIRTAVKESNQIYEILEEFEYVLQGEDVKKRFTIMITPNSILEEI